jgi:hypothetical protein
MQIIFWSIGGAWVLAVAMADLALLRDARSWLLGLWVLRPLQKGADGTGQRGIALVNGQF